MYMWAYVYVWMAVCFHVCTVLTVCSYVETRRQPWVIHQVNKSWVNKSCTLFIEHRSLTDLGLPKDRNTSTCHQVSRFFSHGLWAWDSGLMLPKQALYQLSPSTRKKGTNHILGVPPLWTKSKCNHLPSTYPSLPPHWRWDFSIRIWDGIDIQDIARDQGQRHRANRLWSVL